MAESPQKPAGIKEIAEQLGISIGTVDRALHGRSGISARTREKVLRTAQALNYSPNTAARNLKLSRRLRVGVFLPEQIASFFDLMRAGIGEAAANWRARTGLDITFHTYPRIGEGDLECMEQAQWRQYDGVILAPGEPGRVSTFLGKPNGGPAVVFVATDAPRSRRIASVAVDSSVSGTIAADLLGRLLPTATKVATITGDRRILDHAEKLRGFAGSLATMSPHLSLLAPIESHERPEDAYEAAQKLFRAHRDLGGLYISTANSLPVLRAAEEVGVLDQLHIVATDLYPELIQWIECDKVFCSLYQRPFTQGRLALELLCGHLADNVTPKTIIRLAPHIVLRSNVSLFLDLLDNDETLAT